GIYTPVTDLFLGQAKNIDAIGAGDSAVFNIAVSGGLTFNGNRISAVVDYTNLIAETNEGNNVTTSMAQCKKLPLAVDYTPRLVWDWRDSSALGYTQGATPVVANIDDDNGD